MEEPVPIGYGTIGKKMCSTVSVTFSTYSLISFEPKICLTPNLYAFAHGDKKNGDSTLSI